MTRERTTTAWRLMVARAGWLYGPWSGARFGSPRMTARCRRDPAHEPPDPLCVCGIYSLLDGPSMLEALRYLLRVLGQAERLLPIVATKVHLHGGLEPDPAQPTSTKRSLFRGSVRSADATVREIYIDERWYDDPQGAWPQRLADRLPGRCLCR